MANGKWQMRIKTTYQNQLRGDEGSIMSSPDLLMPPRSSWNPRYTSCAQNSKMTTASSHDEFSQNVE
jgi:hypothetical protein